MTDPRLTPDPARITGRVDAQIMVGHTDLCRTPDGPRDRQLILGDAVTVFATEKGWSYVQARKDDYCGFVHTVTLGEAETPTHRVLAAGSHAYRAPDIKSPDRSPLSFGSLLAATDTTGGFLATRHGYVPLQHVAPLNRTGTDPAACAQLLLHTPYLWGGNSRAGIDCSGLVQAALLACGIPCPGDSDLQQAALGTPLPKGSAVRRNDLLFWRGHVALVVDETTLIHANAGHMAVADEPIADAIARIMAQGDGPVTAHKRLAASLG